MSEEGSKQQEQSIHSNVTKYSKTRGEQEEGWTKKDTGPNDIKKKLPEATEQY